MERHEKELRGDDAGRKEAEMRACFSTDSNRPQNAARPGVLRDTRLLGEIHVPHCQSGEDEEAKVDRTVRTGDVKDEVAELLMWKNPDAMANPDLGSKYLCARGFGALPSHGKKRGCSGVFPGRGSVPRCLEPGEYVRRRGLRYRSTRKKGLTCLYCATS